MGKKYFTISYDDGLEQDMRIVELMKKYGIKGTFNLSSELFGQKTMIYSAIGVVLCQEKVQIKWNKF
jgi:peptidoglycan/xylan/chitin deacetylase (PgdA/CDA1 family)